jgi:hypothetical protein
MGFTQLGLVDPHLNCFGHIDVRLATCTKATQNRILTAPPAHQTRPFHSLPELLHKVYRVTNLAKNDSISLAMADI